MNKKINVYSSDINLMLKRHAYAIYCYAPVDDTYDNVYIVQRDRKVSL
jgi:hypothetical protein